MKRLRLKKVMQGSELKEVSFERSEKIDELSGKLSFSATDDKFMHSVLENDKEKIEEGKIIGEAINQGISSFTPDLMFENIVRNYSNAENLYGKTLLRKITGYDPEYLKRNIRIPEFKKELKVRLAEKIEKMKEDGLLDSEGFTEKGIELASLIMYIEELDNIVARGSLGEVVHKKKIGDGEKENIETFKKGKKYKDLAVKRSLRNAIRRGHNELGTEDLQIYSRKSRGSSQIIYAIDASGSMKGKKIESAKKAGIALAFKAIQKKDKVGLIAFGSDVKEEIKPTDNFTFLLKAIVRLRASRETNIALTLNKAIELFSQGDFTKHLILVTDAMPTVGKEPEKETLEAVSSAKSNRITISLIGINLNKEGKKLAESIVKIGEGRLYVVRDLENIDRIILEDYYASV